MPVWGFADVVESRTPDLAVGERLFGFLPSATHLLMAPRGGPERPVVDTTNHRVELPVGYNVYQRVLREPGYDRADDDLRMLLHPLYLTSWALWDVLESGDWFGAEQVVITSASSKTAIGVAHALSRAPGGPRTLAVTSAPHRAFVEGLGLYTDTVTYDDLETSVPRRPSVVVDMAGSGPVLGRLHRHLGPLMVRSVNVGITHREETGRTPDVITERSETLFAPGVFQKRIKDWGAAEFTRRSTGFVAGAIEASRAWVEVEEHAGLAALEGAYAAMRDGTTPPDRGVVIRP